MTSLYVWMDASHIATITESRGKMELAYVARVATLGFTLISVSMPMSSVSYTDKVVRPFFHGLLPEGPARQTIAYDFGVAERDDVGLLAAIGRDCAGALIVLPEGDHPVVESGAPELLDEDTIEQRIRELAMYPLGVTGKVRASLPGVQPKLVLWGADGEWFTPDGAHPSTHILKPGIVELPGSVINEAFCLHLAAGAGLQTAATSIARFGATSVLVSQRFDRNLNGDGTTLRVQQEDACQALSVMTHLPRHKYEAHGGPTLVRIARVVSNWGGSLSELLRYVSFNVMVGNADLHGKNISLLHRGDGTVELAPMYDVMCTTHYVATTSDRAVDTELGLFIADQTDILAVTADDMVAEAKRWGMRAVTAAGSISELAEAVLVALDGAVARTGAEVPDALVTRIRDRTRSFA